MSTMNAVVRCVPIVSMSWFKHFISKVDNADPRDIETKDYLPDLDADETTCIQSDFVVNEKRKTLFGEQTFVFFEEKQVKVAKTE